MNYKSINPILGVKQNNQTLRVDKTEVNYNIELMKAEYADLCEKYKIPPIEVTNDYVKFGNFFKPLVKYY